MEALLLTLYCMRCPQMVLSDGHTVLHEAAQGGDRDTVRYLLSVGANPQAQDEVRCSIPLASAHTSP